MEQTIFRRRIRGQYFTMHKTIVNDARLSFKAKGIMAYLMSKPDDWDIRLEDVIAHASDGKTSVYSGIKELVDAGYMTRTEVRERGQFGGVVYFIYDEPYTEKPDTEKPDTENQTPTKNKLTKNKKPTPHQEMVGALDEVCQESLVLNGGHMNTLAKDLRGTGYTPEDVFRCFGKGGVWYTETYKGKKGVMPKLYDVRQQIGYLTTLKQKTYADELAEAGYV